MDDLLTLCREIRLAGPAAQQVAELAETLDLIALAPAMDMLATPGCWQEGLDTLKKQLDPDPLGMKMLTCSLLQALKTWENYRELGISREIYVETMACFSRFVDEHMKSFGCYGFDRAFWTVRQLSGRLFRIGELEYELIWGEKKIDLHIPGGSRLRNDILRASWEEAKALISRCFPEYEDAPMGISESWLLSPTLQELLPVESNILRFQRNFRLTPLGTGDSYMQWVFKRTDLALRDLPEDTGLQRHLKAWLLAGGVWQESCGILIEEPFLEK